MKASEYAKTLEANGIKVNRAQQAKNPLTGNKCVRVLVSKMTARLNNQVHVDRPYVSPFCANHDLEWRYVIA